MAREYFRSGFLFKVGISFAASITVALAFWYPLRRAQRAHIQRVTRFAVHAVNTDIADEIKAQLLAQIQLAQLYGLEGSVSKQKWDSYSAIFVAHHPGYSALLLTDASLHVRFSFALPEAQPELDALLANDGRLLRTLREGHQKREAMLSPAFMLRSGESAHAVVSPIYHHDQCRGFLIAVLNDRELLEQVLNDQEDRGYGIAIFEDGQQLYGLPSNDSDGEQGWGQDKELFLSGITWRIRVWPEAVVLGEVEPRLPQLALLMGAIIGLLFSTTIILAWTAYVRSEELGLARDQLEIRVQERTAELKSLNKKLKAEVEERTFAEESLRDLTGRLLQLKDEDQRRLARELHDSTAQIVGALAINLERLGEAVATGNSSKVHDLLSNSNDLAEQATTDLRTICHLLHPPILDDLGLGGALPWYTVGFMNRSGVVVRLSLQDDIGRFPREIELTVFRILQESLANIYRHSGSATADISVFRRENELTLRISDCGRGIPPGILSRDRNSRVMPGVGITGMRERVRQMKGHLDIDSGVGGTCITVVLPLDGSRTPQRETSWDIAQDSLAEKSA